MTSNCRRNFSAELLPASAADGGGDILSFFCSPEMGVFGDLLLIVARSLEKPLLAYRGEPRYQALPPSRRDATKH